VVGTSRKKKLGVTRETRLQMIGLQWLLLWVILIVSYFASPYLILVSYVDAQIGNICVIEFVGFQFA
jgi:hypothetical protein